MRQLSSHNFPRDRRAGPSFVGHVWHVLFLFVMFGRFGSISACIGHILAPLVKCIGVGLVIVCLFSWG